MALNQALTGLVVPKSLHLLGASDMYMCLLQSPSKVPQSGYIRATEAVSQVDCEVN